MDAYFILTCPDCASSVEVVELVEQGNWIPVDGTK